MRQHPQSAQPAQSPAAPEQAAAWRAPLAVPSGAFVVICVGVTALMWMMQGLRNIDL
jgi:hypothetical protein